METTFVDQPLIGLLGLSSHKKCKMVGIPCNLTGKCVNINVPQWTSKLLQCMYRFCQVWRLFLPTSLQLLPHWNLLWKEQRAKTWKVSDTTTEFLSRAFCNNVHQKATFLILSKDNFSFKIFRELENVLKNFIQDPVV